MNDEVLDAVVQAYREEHSGASLDVRAVRQRLVAKLVARQRRRATRLRFAVPLAATFFGSVALAGTHGSMPRFERVRAWLGMSSGEAMPPADRDERPPVLAKRRAPAAPSPAAESVAASLPPAEKVSIEDLPLGPARAPDALGPDLARYSVAHRLHFHGGDPARALEAWSAYLAFHPAGAFAPEARFNRALCLLRLGRRSEARALFGDIERGGGSYARRAREVVEASESEGR